VADYSEFPTTPTAWQERQLQDWQAVTPLSTEDPPQPRHRRRVDLGALIPGVVFIALALVLMTGVDVSAGIFQNGGVLWPALIGGGIALLVRELRARRHQR
jgi:hypothetical protein